MKGQFSIVNAIGTFITSIICIVFLRVLQPIIEKTVTELNVLPNEYTPFVVAFLYLIPFFYVLLPIVSALNYAIFRREGM